MAEIASKYDVEITTGKNSNFSEVVKKLVPDDLDEVFDRSKKAFKSGIDENEEVVKWFKSAKKSLKLKSACVYGAIGAGIMGLGALLCCGGKKQPKQPQNLDQQA